MAESDFAEKINTDDTPVTDVMTGDRDKRMYLYYQLTRSIRQAKQIDITVSALGKIRRITRSFSVPSRICLRIIPLSLMIRNWKNILRTGIGLRLPEISTDIISVRKSRTQMCACSMSREARRSRHCVLWKTAVRREQQKDSYR